MPWWSWVLIWAGLVALLLVVLGVGAVWLYRKAKAMFAELDRLDEVSAQAAQLAEQVDAAREAASAERTLPHILGPHRETALAYHRAEREARAERVAERRERRVARGRALTHADPLQYAHLLNTPTKG
ncbi:hypothetical protein [Gulosibacter faecalis]|jgi:flagellar biosynthesis/type III secretory pathway M-ring protein FliF/YscJ|uniref:Uncharacterized protein n=1 Tax=Gulosibacter faecalis TaxID=272240 RepID=A0ABW5V1F5_9MICO|nr:hypothetical protein [Gulosibacter faecalis]